MTAMDLSVEVVKQVVHNKLGACDFEIVSFDVAPPKGDSFGFLSSNNILTVDLRHNSQMKELRFFMKSVVHGNDYHERLLTKMEVNKREKYLYDQVLKVLTKYLPKKVFPECYYCSETLLIMEDLSELGYKCKNVHEYFDLDHIYATLERIALLHCASIAYEIKEKVSVVDKFPQLLQEPLFTSEDGHPCTNYMKASVEAIKCIMDVYCDHIPKELKEKVIEHLENIYKFIKPSHECLNTLSHSDLWANNIMFLYGPNKEILSTYIIDYQLARYLPPAFDVLLSIFFLTSPHLRESKDEGLEHLLVHYYHHLSKDLQWNGIDVKDVLTWEDFRQMCDTCLPQVLALNIQYFHYITVPAEILQPIIKSPEKYRHYVETDRTEVLLEAMRTNEPYRRRLLQALNEGFHYFKKHSA